MTRVEIANICKAMSDANRLKIIEMLTSGEKCGCELLEELQVTQPTLSHHMKVLSDFSRFITTISLTHKLHFKIHLSS